MKLGFPWLLYGPVLLILPCAGSRAADDKGCVWRLQGPAATVYLAGSIHLLREGDHPLPDVYEKAYEDCARVVFEIDLESTRTVEGQQLSVKLGMLPAGQSMDQLLSPETVVALRGYLDQRGVQASQMERLTPGMLAMTITSMEAMRIGALPRFGVEATFDQMARDHRKPIGALETLEFQLNLFNGMTPAEQERMLRITLDEVEETPKVLASMIQAWREGDGDKLAEELNRNFEPEDAGLVKRLLHERNQNWIPAIEQAIQKPEGENTLFIVGAGHLVGEKSVVALLEEKGYRPQHWFPAE